MASKSTQNMRRFADSGYTAGFRNSELQKGNPYMRYRIESIRREKSNIAAEIDRLTIKSDIAKSVIANTTLRQLQASQKSVLTKAQKRIAKLNKQYAQAEYAEKQAARRKTAVPF